jgi:glutathione S-transferase
MPEDAKKIFRDRLVSRFQWVDGQFAGKPYLMGHQFTVADGYLYVVTRWAKAMNIDLSSLANLTAHHERVGARPAVQEALKAEGLLGK